MNCHRLLLAIVVLAIGCSNARHATTRPTPTVQPATVVIDPIIARIREEGLERSQLMDTLDHLCNVIGPRLTASPGQQRASAWTRDRLAGWGLADAHLEAWGPFGRGWSVERFSMRVTEPAMFIPIAYPRAWSPGLDAPRSAEVVFLDARTEEELLDYDGQLAGKIVLIGQPRNVDARFEPLARRLTDADLAKLADFVPGDAAVERQPNETASERRARFAQANAGTERLMGGTRPTTSTTRNTTQRSATRTSTRRAATTRSTAPASQATDARNDPFAARLVAFAAEQGAAVLVTSSWKGDGGTFFVQQASIPGEPPRRGAGPSTRPRVWSDDAPTIPPQITMGVEDFNRIARIARRGETVRAEIDLATVFHGTGVSPANVIAEIPGTDLADEVVMIGAHLDSWHAGTGATDNAVGSACAMEAVRIIHALGLRPRRTIRVALWTGEEQGLFGSEAYVKRHFGHIEDQNDAVTRPTFTSPKNIITNGPTTRPTQLSRAERLVKAANYEKLSAYFNLDNGTGRIRGIYAQGNAAAVPHFRAWLAPFADLDARTVTLQNTGGTDHIPFDAVGLPGFQFIQDPMEYGSRTHHSNMDVYDRVPADDARQAATIMAAFVWNAANMDERFPRNPVEPRAD